MTSKDYDSLIPPGFGTTFAKTVSTNTILTENSMHNKHGQVERSLFCGSAVQLPSASLRKQRSPRGQFRPPKQRTDAPSMTRTITPAVPVTPLVPAPGSSINTPVLIDDESDKKIELNPLSELNPPPKAWLRNECSAPRIHEQSKTIISHVKSVLVFQLTSGSMKNIEAMVKCANNAFSNLDLLGHDYTSFHNDVKCFIKYHYHFLNAERERDMQSFPELRKRHEDALNLEKVLEHEVFLTRGHEEMVNKKREPLERRIKEAMELIGVLKHLVSLNERDAEVLKHKKQICIAAHENAKEEVQKLGTQVEAAKDVLRKIDQRKIAALNGIESTTRRLKSIQS